MIGNNSYTVLETTTRMNPTMIMTRTKTIPIRTMVSIRIIENKDNHFYCRIVIADSIQCISTIKKRTVGNLEDTGETSSSSWVQLSASDDPVASNKNLSCSSPSKSDGNIVGPRMAFRMTTRL